MVWCQGLPREAKEARARGEAGDKLHHTGGAVHPEDQIPAGMGMEPEAGPAVASLGQGLVALGV